MSTENTCVPVDRTVFILQNHILKRTGHLLEVQNDHLQFTFFDNAGWKAAARLQIRHNGQSALPGTFLKTTIAPADSNWPFEVQEFPNDHDAIIALEDWLRGFKHKMQLESELARSVQFEWT